MKSFVCAICKKSVAYETALPAIYPFCSERCKQVDLGNWLLGKYAIERDVTDEDVPLDPAPAGRKQRAGGERADAESEE